MKAGPREAAIVRKIMLYLADRGGFVWKQQAGPRAPMAGLPDVFYLEAGTLYAIEVKRPGERPTPIQERRILELRKSGAVAIVACSVDDVRGLFYPKPHHAAN